MENFSEYITLFSERIFGEYSQSEVIFAKLSLVNYLADIQKKVTHKGNQDVLVISSKRI